MSKSEAEGSNHGRSERVGRTARTAVSLIQGVRMHEESAATILLVDDEPDLLTAWRRVLRKAGFHVRMAAEGGAAFESARSERPDLILSDVQMPAVGGIELCRQIRSHAELSAIPVILYSSQRKTSENAVEGLRAGADDYIETPVDPALLVAKVVRGVERRREEEARERLIADLRAALDEVKTLQGILPICSYCKSIRRVDNFWEEVESYVAAHTDARFSHGVCPDCYDKELAPQIEEMRRSKNDGEG